MKKKRTPNAPFPLYATMFGLTFILFAILSFALTLPYNLLFSNEVLKESFGTNLLSILIDLFEILAYAAGATLLIYAAFRPFSAATVWGLGGLFALTSVLRYAMELIGAWILYGTKNFLYNILEPTLFNLFPYVCLDLAFVLLSVILALSLSDHYYRKKAVLSKASVLFQNDETLPTVEGLYPFQRVLNLKNPIQLCAFILGLVLVAANVISNLLFDVNYLINAITVSFLDVLSMVGSYAYSVMIGIVFYGAYMLLFQFLFQYRNKAAKK